MHKLLYGLGALVLSACVPETVTHSTGVSEGWTDYGGSLSGDRYAENSAITPQTVRQLKEAWRYQTGDASNEPDDTASKFRATPIIVNNKLVVSTGRNRVIALDPGSGKELWSFDPRVNFSIGFSEKYTSRGVAAWTDRTPGEPLKCSHRVFLGTLDARLIAIDADTGNKCQDFGKRGAVNLSTGIKNYRKSDYSITSPPTVVGDVVIVGSSIGDNGAAELESGVIRAFNVRTGLLVWSWDPIPRNAKHPGVDTWQSGVNTKTGGANVWSVMAADVENDLVFLPTTSPSPDFYGGKRLGDNAYANSIVALRASSGEFVWAYQTVKHDLWDYDLAAQPLLFEYKNADGTSVPALAQASKTGFVFVLDRITGKPLHNVEDRAVPQSKVPGEEAAKTQRFPKIQLHETRVKPLKIWDHTPEHFKACSSMLKNVQYDGIFTPPSFEGTLLFPGNPGGTNWGSMAYDKKAQIAFLTINRLPTVVKLIPRAQFRAAKASGLMNGVEAQHTEQEGTPYGMARFELYNRNTGIPCLEGPWASLVAVDLNSGKIVWQKPAGVAPGLENDQDAADWGYFAVGGPLVTSGGVVFLATPFDYSLRAYSGRTGEELWRAQQPAGVHATPMSYRHNGSDFVVVTAGDKLQEGEGRGDYVIAYKLFNDEAIQ